MPVMMKVDACPCGKAVAYDACCAIQHQQRMAADAETLMRSRYTAYVLGLEPYLLDTWHPTTRPPSLGIGSDIPTQWIGLEVKQFRQSGEEATVEFVARYKINGRAYLMNEISRFVFEQGRWFYLDGSIRDKAK